MESLKSQQSSVVLPWLLLVTPAKAWQSIKRTPHWYWAVALHWLATVLGSIIAFGPTQELLFTAGLAAPGRQTLSSIIATAIFSLVGILAGLTAASLAMFLLTRAIGFRSEFSKLFNWLAFGLVPLSIGLFLAKLQFTIIQPLADGPELALAYLLKPFSLGLATFASGSLPPLSFGWFIFSYFDVFGVWSLWLLAIGAGTVFELSFNRKFWLITELVLLFFAVITGLWNLTQFVLLRLTG